MKRRITLLLPIFMLVPFNLQHDVIARAGQVADSVHTPAKGDPERKALMDALRDDYKKATGDQVTFMVNYLKVHNGWAWTDITPLGKDGKPVAEGGPQLLHFEKDKWIVIDLSKIPEDPNDPLGPEDASPRFIKNIQKKYPDVPTDIFPKKRK
jgi:hypothetical protein